jgi:hypothetical protein
MPSFPAKATQRIHYIAADHTERYSDPEEKVRAEFCAELIYKYEYKPERMRFEVKVPRRTPPTTWPIWSSTRTRTTS